MLGLVTLSRATANSIVAAIDGVLTARALGPAKMVGFASDGAAVMTGVNNGVASQLGTKYPGLISLHCCTHRLELAVEDSTDLYEDERLHVLRDLYSYFNKSSNRQLALQQAILDLKLPMHRIIQGGFTRWLSIGNALANVFAVYDAICVVLQADKVAATASHLYDKYFATDTFYYWVAFMNDVMGVINGLSKSLQAKKLNIVAVHPVVAETVRQLELAFGAAAPLAEPSTTSLTDAVGRYKSNEVGTCVWAESLGNVSMHCVSFISRLARASTFVSRSRPTASSLPFECSTLAT